MKELRDNKDMTPEFEAKLKAALADFKAKVWKK